MKNNNSLRKDAFSYDGYGRGIDNKMSRTTKRKIDRVVDKRRRRAGKAEISIFETL